MSAQEFLDQAAACKETDPARAETLYKQVLEIEAASNQQESALAKLGELYRDQKNAEGVAQLITLSRGFMSSTAKAKTAKLIRTLLDFFNAIPNSQQIQIGVLKDNIDWAKKEKRIFLKHSLETRLVSLQLDTAQHKPALKLIDTLLTELKRLDDKLILTEVHLLESRAHLSLRNLPKAKAALTSSRTAANSIYCPPYLQSALDLQAGILHAEERDWTTAYSYFFEAFEGLSSLGEESALGAFKYMLLCKVMLNLVGNPHVGFNPSSFTHFQPDDVNSLLTIKLALKYAQLREVESMRAIARAHQNRNLADFEKALRDYQEGTLIPSTHLEQL